MFSYRGHSHRITSGGCVIDLSRYRRYGLGNSLSRTVFPVGSWRCFGSSSGPEGVEKDPHQVIQVATDEELGGVIQLVKVEPLVQKNSKLHHTDKFDQVDDGDLIVRRGQPFKMDITFNRPFDQDKDDIRLVFETGDSPLPAKGTLVRFILSDEDKPKEWGAMITASKGNDITVTVFTPPNCIVGKWEFSVESIIQSNTDGTDDFLAFKPDFSLPFYMLFNPWCKDDSVYFPRQNLLSEYILNDRGAIFTGNHKQIGYRHWWFGQFEDGILEAAMYCVLKAFNGRVTGMGDPVKVSRAITKIVNCNDDGGVLLGNWSGKYEGGTSPCAWIGSVTILQKYFETKMPVKFGQCFVFSGLVTTICRAIGIPSRSVTNFASAHDTDASVSIDTYWDVLGDTIDYMNSDSIWNFHVWNDAWMKRPDLPMGYGGWQGIDSTPQEESQGVMQCGPVPLKAILNGQCDLQYDAPFVFAEVNADKVHWGRTRTGDFEVLGIEKSAVGKFISTKKPDGKGTPIVREDVTHQYKYEDESDKERISVISASRAATRAKPIYCQGSRDLKFSIIQHDHILIGDCFEIKLIIENTSPQTRNVSGRLLCDAVSYTGKMEQPIKSETFRMSLAPKEKLEVAMNVSCDEYVDRLSEFAAMKMSIIARCPETKQVQAWQDDFRLRKPDLGVEVLTTCPRVKEELTMRISLKNPFKNQDLTNCKLRIEGPGIRPAKELSFGTIATGAAWSTDLDVVPQKLGFKMFIAAFECDQLNDVSGNCEVDIQ